MKQDTKWIKTIMANINNYIFGGAKLSSTLDSASMEDFSEEINHAMIALDMETDSEKDALPILSAPSAAPVLSVPKGAYPINQPTGLEESASHHAAIHANNSLETSAEVVPLVPDDVDETNIVSG
jgi:hypothetical protein